MAQSIDVRDFIPDDPEKWWRSLYEMAEVARRLPGRRRQPTPKDCEALIESWDAVCESEWGDAWTVDLCTSALRFEEIIAGESRLAVPVAFEKARELAPGKGTLMILAWACFELSKRTDDASFFLSGRNAARELGLRDHSHASVMLRGLCRRRVIERTRAGHTGLANDYRWIGGPEGPTESDLSGMSNGKSRGTGPGNGQAR